MLLLESALDDQLITTVYTAARAQFGHQKLHHVLWLAFQSVQLLHKSAEKQTCTYSRHISAKLMNAVFFVPARVTFGGFI
jgi:hypothetical protein